MVTLSEAVTATRKGPSAKAPAARVPEITLVAALMDNPEGRPLAL